MLCQVVSWSDPRPGRGYLPPPQPGQAVRSQSGATAVLS